MAIRIPILPVDRHELYKKYSYSVTIKSGDLLFISGQVGN